MVQSAAVYDSATDAANDLNESFASVPALAFAAHPSRRRRRVAAARRCRLRNAPGNAGRHRRRRARADRPPARVDQPRQSGAGAPRRDHRRAAGVSVDLARALADEIAVPLELVVVDSAGASVEAVRGGQADVGFFAIDPGAAKASASRRPTC